MLMQTGCMASSYMVVIIRRSAENQCPVKLIIGSSDLTWHSKLLVSDALHWEGWQC